VKYFAILLLCVPICLAQNEPAFRGGFIGQPLSDYADCSSRKPKSIREGYKAYGKCDGKVAITRTHARSFMDPDPVGETFRFENQKLVEILIYIKNEDWEKTKYDLTQKLGQPRSEIPQIYQNGFGARWEFPQGFWSDGRIVAAARVKVDEFAGVANHKFFSNEIATKGIEIIITDAERAKLPSTQPNSLD
jgi:hypothetical protein